MEPARIALLEARLARETTETALARCRAAVEHVGDIGERLRVSGLAIRVSLDLLYEVEAHGPGFSLQREPPSPQKNAVLDPETLAKLARLIEVS